uniref:Ovule protein n=1 Tax=Haemonchus placei TaxID=6290 RepID=A0A0N4WDA3_HAEPC
LPWVGESSSPSSASLDSTRHLSIAKGGIALPLLLFGGGICLNGSKYSCLSTSAAVFRLVGS